MNSRYAILYSIIALIVAGRVIFVGNPPLLADGEEVRFVARLTTSPRFKGQTQQFTLRTSEGHRFFITTTTYPRFMYGELLSVSGRLEQQVLSNGKIINTLPFPEIAVTDDSNLLFTFAGWVRERVRQTFVAVLPPTASALLLGIVFGQKADLSQEFVNDLSKTGLMHIVAASGMNVALVAGFLMTTLGRFLRRTDAIKVSLVGIGFYTVLAGLEPSIVRAALMASITFVAALLGRQQTAVISLFITASIMLFIDPVLLEDIGFQLSFAATAGMIFLRPLLLFSSGKKKKKDVPSPVVAFVQDDIAATLAAQLTAVPLLLLYFHEYGIFSTLVNLFVLWTIPPLMVIGGIAGVVGLVITPMGSIIALLSLPFLLYFETAVRLFAPITPVISFEYLPWPLVGGYYLLIAALLIAKKQKTVE